jgi:WD40 repeat protein
MFSALAMAPDSKSFVISDQNGVLHLWNLNGKSEIRVIRSPDGGGKMVGNLVFSPDGKTLIAIHLGKRFTDGVAVLWNTTDWTAHSMSGYTSAAFSRDGQLLALGGPDIKLFDVSGRELRTMNVPAFTKGEVLPGFADRPDAREKVPCGVSALAFSPDAATLAVGCFEGTLRIMKLTP